MHGLLVTWYAQFQGNEVRDMSGAANTQKTKECCGRTWEEAQVQAALRPDLCARGALSAKLAILHALRDVFLRHS